MDLSVSHVLDPLPDPALKVRDDFSLCWRSSWTPIGSGAAATVFRGSPLQERDGATGTSLGQVAIKVCHQTKGNEAERRKELDAIANEARLLEAAGSHPNLVQFFGLFFIKRNDQQKMAMVLEYFPCGDLFSAVLANLFDENAARAVCKGVLTGLGHLHSVNILHRDVKADNVLMRENGDVALTDLGIACFADDESRISKRAGSPGYVAPEVIQSESITFKVDVFGTGCLLFFVLSGCIPFPGSTLASIFRRTVKSPPNFHQSKRFNEVSPACLSAIKLMLNKSPLKRPAAAQALENPWFTSQDDPWLEGALSRNSLKSRARHHVFTSVPPTRGAASEDAQLMQRPGASQPPGPRPTPSRSEDPGLKPDPAHAAAEVAGPAPAEKPTLAPTRPSERQSLAHRIRNLARRLVPRVLLSPRAEGPAEKQAPVGGANQQSRPAPHPPPRRIPAGSMTAVPSEPSTPSMILSPPSNASEWQPQRHGPVEFSQRLSEEAKSRLRYHFRRHRELRAQDLEDGSSIHSGSVNGSVYLSHAQSQSDSDMTPLSSPRVSEI